MDFQSEESPMGQFSIQRSFMMTFSKYPDNIENISGIWSQRMSLLWLIDHKPTLRKNVALFLYGGRRPCASKEAFFSRFWPPVRHTSHHESWAFVKILGDNAM